MKKSGSDLSTGRWSLTHERIRCKVETALKKPIEGNRRDEVEPEPGGRGYGSGWVEEWRKALMATVPLERSHAPKLKIAPRNSSGIGDDVAVVYDCRAEVDHNLRVAPRV